MPVYISLGRFRREGAMEIKKHLEGLEQARKAVESVGGKIKERKDPCSRERHDSANLAPPKGDSD